MIILGSLKGSSGLPNSINWTFIARCYGWGATSEYRFKIVDFAPTGVGWPKISGWRGRPHLPFFFVNYRLNDLSYLIKTGQIVFFPFCHNLCVFKTDRKTDRRTDRWTEFSSLDSVCIPRSSLKSCWDAVNVNSSSSRLQQLFQRK